MDCEKAEKLLSRMIFDELKDEQKTELSEHLAGCPACSETLAGMRRAVYLIREGLEAQTPVLSPERREAVLGETEKQQRIAPSKAKKPQQTVPGKVKKSPLMRRSRVPLAPKTDRLPLFTGIGAAAAGITFVIIIAGMFAPSFYKNREESEKISDTVAMRSEQAYDEPSVIEPEQEKRINEGLLDTLAPASPAVKPSMYKSIMKLADSRNDGRRAKKSESFGKGGGGTLLASADTGTEREEVGAASARAPQIVAEVKRLKTTADEKQIEYSRRGDSKTSYLALAVPKEKEDISLSGNLSRSRKSESLPAKQERRMLKSDWKDKSRKAAVKMVPVNPFVTTKKNRFSTFAINVNITSYTRTRSYIRNGYLPPAASVRTEEFINAFDYNYPRQTNKAFAVHAKAAPSPFGMALTLIKIGIKGRVLGRDGRKPAHLVFVVDASKSMARQDRMPLIQYGLTALVGKLKPSDRVSLVTCGTQSRLILEAVPADKKKQIAAAVRSIQCGGSTNLVEGLALGYSTAGRHFRAGEINRVILCSGGIANVGATGAEQMLKRVETFRSYGITFSSVGFGRGAYNDALLEKLANSGDGTYSFCDSRAEARRIFVEEMSAEIQTIARDAKIRVEFNERRISRYRLIGYESRDIADDRFRGGTVDAGEIGSGHSATALYEVELLGTKSKGEVLEHLGKVYVRYRNADTGRIEEVSHRLENDIVKHRRPEKEPRYFLAACAAEFAEILRMSKHAKNGNLAEVQRLLDKVAGKLPLDQKVRELLWMVKRAQGLPRAG